MAVKKAVLTLKIGDKEVRYEADRDAVEAQLHEVLGRLLPEASRERRAALEVEAEDGGESVPPAAEETELAAEEAEPSEAERLSQVFGLDSDERLHLRRRPPRAVDGLLLVLYGLWKLKGEVEVTAPAMSAVARSSGVRFRRADRLLDGCGDLARSIGSYRSRLYKLTEAGREHCARLVRELSESGDPEPSRS